VARPARDADEVEGLDEEFLFHLNRGSELLGKGDAEGARASLERAAELRAKDAKVLGLLGQACYRLGRFDDACAAWQRLVDDNPTEPAARVNLGLASLKARRYPDAVRQLEIALDLNPDHRKAMGYLGLALLEAGDPRGAREWFAKGGSEHMVARCDEALRAAAGRAAAPAPTPPPPAVEVAPVEVAAEPPRAPEPVRAREPPPEPARTPEPAHTPEIVVPPRAAVGAPGSGLAAWAASRLARPGAGETFSVDGDTLAVSVRGAVLVRTEGLFASRGRLSLAGEVKRFRGRPTDKPFGEGSARMHRASGEGVLLFRAGGRRFTSLDLAGEAGYFREEVVFGLEEPVAFENGRVPSSTADLNLVHLRGRGRFLLATRASPVAVDVTPDAPLRVPLAALVGWVGNLTPRVTALVEGDEGGTAAVELTGEGRVLADPAAAAGLGG
jgi:uncharacterized protein (AIM24 family)